MSKRELGRGVLQMYTDLLCEKGSTVNLKRFAKTVTNKVSYFSQPNVFSLTRIVVAASFGRR
jgi:hypothetical protein